MEHGIITKGMQIFITGTLVIMALKLSDWILIGFTAVCLVSMSYCLIKKSETQCRQMADPGDETALIPDMEPDKETIPGADEAASPDVRAEAWYRMTGRAVLTDLITDQNVHGQKQLFIKENGDVVIKDTVCASLKQFPDRSVWDRLAVLIKGDGLIACVDENGITVLW